MYHHRDMNHLEPLLARRPAGRRTLIVTDGLFSMDGDIAPMKDLVQLAERGMVQSSMSTMRNRNFGRTGRVPLEHCEVESRVPSSHGDLGAAPGSAGDVTGSATFTASIWSTPAARSFTPPFAPATAAAATAAIQVIEAGTQRRAPARGATANDWHKVSAWDSARGIGESDPAGDYRRSRIVQMKYAGPPCTRRICPAIRPS